MSSPLYPFLPPPPLLIKSLYPKMFDNTFRVVFDVMGDLNFQKFRRLIFSELWNFLDRNK